MSGLCSACASAKVRPPGYEFADPVCPNCSPHYFRGGGRA